MKRFLVSAILASTIFTVHAISAAAYLVCFDDPAVNVVTPAGNNVTVWVTDYAWDVDPSVLANTTITYSVQSAPHGNANGLANANGNANAYANGNASTLVTMAVTIPQPDTTAFHTAAVYSSGPNGTGLVYGRVDGTSGQPMVLSFLLPIG